MAKFKNLAKEQFIQQLIQEFVESQHKSTKSVLCEGLDIKSNLYHAIQLGEQTGKQIQVDIINEYFNQHPVLKEDIFQRGLAKTKAWLTTPLGKGFGQAKDTQVIQNLFGALKKNTEKIVSAGPSPYAPSEEDVKNSPTQIGQVGALIGKRFAALQNNPKLNAPATPAEIQAGMGRIEGLISKIRSSGMVKGVDNILDEIGIFARQHPMLTNMIVAGLVAVLTMTTGGGLFGIPMLGKFLIGTALRTFIGMLKGEKATQAAAKAAVVSGAGIAIGKILGLFYDKIAAWLSGPSDGSALPLPPGPAPAPAPVAPDIDTSHLGQEEYLSSYRGMLFNKALNATSSEEFQTYLQQIQNADAQYGFNGELPEWDPSHASGALPTGGLPQAPAEPYSSPEDLRGPGAPDLPDNTPAPAPAPVAPVAAPTLTDLRPKLDSLAKLASSTDVRGATAPAARQAVQNWVAGISQPEAQSMLADPNVTNQLARKGALGLLKKKFGLQESELDLIKAELMGGAIALTEANPFTAAKNFMTGGPEVGGKNARLDYKQVESDYLKFLNNMESSLGLKTEKDILDTLKKYDKSFPGVYDYVMKVRNWLYGATPEANKPQPESVIVPPQEIPTPTNPEPSPTNPTKPEDNPNKPEAPTPGPGGGYSNKNLAKYLTALKGSPLFAGNLQQRVLGMLKAADNPNSPEAKAGMATLKTFLINFSKAISDASAQYRQKVGDPNAVRKEVESNPEFAKLAEAAADLLAQNKERQAFLGEFNAAIPNLVGATVELRQIFNKNNPNSIYNFKAQPEQPAQPPKLPMPAQKPGLKIAPPVIGGQKGLPAGFSPKVTTEDLETRGKPAATNPGASGNLTGPDIANARAMFAKLIDLGPILQKVNPNSLDKASLKQLIITFLDIGDVLVYKKGSKKTNKAVDAALQGLDILGPGGAAAPQAQQGGFTPKEKTLITLRVPPTLEDTGGLLPKALYQYYGGKWNVVTAKGLQPLDTKNMAKQIAKLTSLAKAGRNDYDEAIKLMKTNAKDKGAGIDFAVGNQVKEGLYDLRDYRKFFI